jgi:hypothetical protein
MINTITTLSVIISCCSYFQLTLLRFCLLLLFYVTVADFWVSCLSTLVLFLQKLDLALQAFDCERTWRRLFQKRVVRTKLFAFVRCFACPKMPVALDSIFLQDCPFWFSVTFISISISTPLYYSNFHVRQTL